MQQPIGRSQFIKGGSNDENGNYVAPVKAVGGRVDLAADTLNQAITAAAGTGLFDFITRVILVCTATAGVAAEVKLKDKLSGGTVLRSRIFNVAGPALHTVVEFVFDTPVMCAVANGQFVIDTVGAGVTWGAEVDGFKSSILNFGGNKA